jgi:hypothetical protein
MRRWLPFLPLLLLGWLAYLHVERGAKQKAGTGTTAASPAGNEVQEARAKEQTAYEQQTQARIDELAKMETAKRDRDRLAVQGSDARITLQASKSAVWASLITSNWQTFLALRKQAAASPAGTVPCAICDGHGSMDFCVLCGHSGKCVTCKGSGKSSLGEDCATCRGERACFLCFGSGAMPCPFCEGGFITSRGPLPPDQMPVLGETPLPQTRQPAGIAADHPLPRHASNPPA